MGDAIKLIGIVIVIIGFALKFDTLATVVVAGIVTGLVGGMSIMDILSTLGSAFLTNRTATLFILTLPVIGLCERMGLRDKAVDFISGIKSATTGRLLSIWQVIRTIASAFSLRIGGHPQFIRPLINPMAQACAIAKYGEVDEKTEDEIKGMAAGTENYGNFFAQNCFMGSSGTLLIVSTLNEIFKSNNIAQEVTANQIALNSIPIAVISVIVGIGYPFLIAQGANPVVVGALGLTAGYCGTLMTPMAANFNIMPAALLETKSKYAIIISQLPVALIMLAIHIVLMYVLAF